MPAITRSSQVATVTSSSVEVTNGMVVGQKYALICTSNCWFRVAVTSTSAAKATADNVYLPGLTGSEPVEVIVFPIR